MTNLLKLLFAMERLNPQLRKAEVALGASYKRGYLIWGALLAGGINTGFGQLLSI